MKTYLKTITEWQAYLATLHAKTINLGLERVREVARRLKLLNPQYLTIMVGGTNGKGSTARGFEAIYEKQGYKVGKFTSPYLLILNEEICIAGKNVSDEALISAFNQIEEARLTISLTTFEFMTLAALIIFKQDDIDIGILEVGLGGRLDAVNIIDAKLAVITSIAIDHTDWLGDTREQIGFEKAGIMRPGQLVVCGDSSPPQTLQQYAKIRDAQLFIQGRDFLYTETNETWRWQAADITWSQLPMPPLSLQNMSTVLMGVALLQTQLPVSLRTIRAGLQCANLRGRQEIILGKITHILDVAHNPAAAAALAKKLAQFAQIKPVRAVFAMLKDKDIAKTIREIKEFICSWYIAPLDSERSANTTMLETAFKLNNVESVFTYTTVGDAYENAYHQSQPGDIIVIFGSFYTVAACFSLLKI